MIYKTTNFQLDFIITIDQKSKLYFEMRTVKELLLVKSSDEMDEARNINDKKLDLSIMCDQKIIKTTIKQKTTDDVL